MVSIAFAWVIPDSSEAPRSMVKTLCICMESVFAAVVRACPLPVDAQKVSSVIFRGPVVLKVLRFEICPSTRKVVHVVVQALLLLFQSLMIFSFDVLGDNIMFYSSDLSLNKTYLITIFIAKIALF